VSPVRVPALAPGSVLVGYDDRPVAGSAVDWAAEEAARGRRPLVVVHCPGSTGIDEGASLDLAEPLTDPTLAAAQAMGRRVLDPALARVRETHPDLSVRALVVLGEPGIELLRLSHRVHTLVVGSRGHGVTRTLPTGQLGAWLARHTASRLVVVPRDDADRPRQGVAVGVRAGDPRTPRVLDAAFEQAGSRGVALTVVHATHDALGSGESDRRRWLADALEGRVERFPDMFVSTVVVQARPARTLLRVAGTMELLVVGQHLRLGLHDLPVGHVRSSIVDRSPCPTLVVPAEAPADISR
jgi:nucleotide-binding universal stress UspA family protein